jgi:hypothetical protein
MDMGLRATDRNGWIGKRQGDHRYAVSVITAVINDLLVVDAARWILMWWRNGYLD